MYSWVALAIVLSPFWGYPLGTGGVLGSRRRAAEPRPCGGARVLAADFGPPPVNRVT